MDTSKKKRLPASEALSPEIMAEADQKAQDFITFCRKNRIPATLVYNKGIAKDKAQYTHYIVTPVECGTDINPDYITPTVAMFLNGFKIVPSARARDNVFDADEIAGGDF